MKVLIKADMERSIPLVILMLIASLLELTSGPRAFAGSKEDEFRRPELVAIAWASNSQDKLDIQQAWRPDGSIIGEEERLWISKNLQGPEPEVWTRGVIRGANEACLPALIVLFKADPRAPSLDCRIRSSGATVETRVAEEFSIKHSLSLSTIAPLRRSLTEWPAEVDIVARVRSKEPKTIAKVEQPFPAHFDVMKGVRWRINNELGRQWADGHPKNGFPAAVMEMDAQAVDQMSPIYMSLKTRSGKFLATEYVKTFAPPDTRVLHVSNALDESDPLEPVSFIQNFYRDEAYDHVPIRRELILKMTPPR